MSESQPEDTSRGVSEHLQEENASATNENAALPAAANSSRLIALLSVMILLCIGAGAYFTTNENAYKDLCRVVSGKTQKRRINPITQFNFKNAIIPKDDIINGGPGKDGIPAISKPKFLAAEEADYLKPDDRVIGVVIDDQPRAYPLRILITHENVNDSIGQNHFAVVYCPLCDSASVLDRKSSEGEVMEFGISGLLYNNNVLLYDRTKNESLWSQMQRQSVTGVKVEQRLTTLPLVLTSWSDWQKQHPNTQVLSTDTGFPRDYSQMPYDSYFAVDELMFPMNFDNPHPEIKKKARMLCIWSNNKTRCYSLDLFQQQGKAQTLQEELDGKAFEVTYKPDANSLQITKADEGVEWMYAFWFAWAAFHKNTEVYELEKVIALQPELNSTADPANEQQPDTASEPKSQTKE